MTERRVEVRTYRVEYRCDKCDSLMENTGVYLPSLPPKFRHRCRNKHTADLPRRYPTVDYIDNEDDE